MSDEVSTETQEGQTSQTTTRDSGEEGYQNNGMGAESSATETNSEQIDSRPDWLPQKFETPEQLAVSYGELEKSLHTNFHQL